MENPLEKVNMIQYYKDEIDNHKIRRECEVLLFK